MPAYRCFKLRTIIAFLDKTIILKAVFSTDNSKTLKSGEFD